MTEHPHAACVLVVSGDKVLAITRGRDWHDWALPGGVVETGESIVGAASRELREETGIVVRPRDLTPVYHGVSHRFLTTTFVPEYIDHIPYTLQSDPFEGYVGWVHPSVLVRELCTYRRYAQRMLSNVGML